MEEPRRCRVRRYRFTEGPATLVLRIPEVLDPQYGMFAWPCAVVLAQFLWARRSSLPGKRVLEVPTPPRRYPPSPPAAGGVLPLTALRLQLGAGVGLPGVLAAKCGAEVTLSDSEELPRCLQNCRRSCGANGLPGLPVLGLTWGRLGPALLALPAVDIILGSDVFFDPKGIYLTISRIQRLTKTA
ncbi:histone-arginine methyltransferase METTL23 isoform X3 [Apus apus]|uniref:histone-arginine methyltransferase METTL23 isoform X3 n=1 Tax=Apus apus TaxID=8895 RepID=UPI0021F84A92|nr:histone-arginine methyltransferase METTL23 isoform X3 [Apus apus]